MKGAVFLMRNDHELEGNMRLEKQGLEAEGWGTAGKRESWAAWASALKILKPEVYDACFKMLHV